ncbi:MAG: sensor histidine kinase, partial [Anaerolineae bacterium]
NLSISLVATGLVAVLFHPLRERLQRGINRLMFGKRDDPLGVMGELNKQIEAAVSPESLLPSVVSLVAQTLRLPYVALEATNSEDQKRRTAQLMNASYGTPTNQNERVRFPLIVQGQQIGALSVALREGQQSLSAADKRILQTIAAQISSIVQALRLTADLQESRQRIVAAREEERRRLRRDLHDSVGPMLATLSLQTEAARDLITVQPQQSDALLGDVLVKLQAVLGDIRRVVYGLRPPALDDLGLASALREQIALYSQGGININVTIADPLPLLSAATEVAIYRIAQEALTNMKRHSGAANCTLALSIDQKQKLILLEVDDDGRGFAEGARSGVGLYSMHERAAELSGTCIITAAPGKGTRVKVMLPW